MTELDPFIAALRSRTERARAESAPTPDVVEVVDRALERDHGAVASGLRAVVDGDRAEPEAPVPELAAFTGALRNRTERASDDRRLRAVPRPPARAAPRRWPLLVAAAAAIVLGVGLSGLHSRTLTQQAAANGNASERLAPIDRDDEATTRKPRLATSTRERTVQSELPAESEPEPEPEPLPEVKPQAPEAPPRVSLDELEARAQRLWSAGDLSGADKALRAVIRRAGRTRRAELAYADLFAVAAQRGGSDARARVWKQYLRRFPKGRFADDVQAGLCRRESHARQADCWRRYLAAHPEGAHAREAREVTSTSP